MLALAMAPLLMLDWVDVSVAPPSSRKASCAIGGRGTKALHVDSEN